MLSEANPGAGWRARLMRLLFADNRPARRIGAGLGLLAVVGLGTASASPSLVQGLPLSALLLFAVGVVAWYGGWSVGLIAAILGPALELGLQAVSGAAIGAPEIIGATLTAMVLAVVARVTPGIRGATDREREWANTDPLTGLGNRRYFYDVAALELNRTRRYKRPLALVYIDCDGFESINQRRGYAEGDALLRQMATALRTSMRASDTVARIAGDEFALLLPETPGPGAEVAVGKIRERLEQAIVTARDPLGFSMAVIAYDSGPASATELLRQADALMIEVKREARGSTRQADYEHPEMTGI